MTKKALRVGLAGCAAFAALAAGNAQAATDTDSFEVSIVIEAVCTVDAAATDIDLGTVDSNATNTSSTGSITVKCSNTLPYNVGLTPSNGNTAGAGIMSSPTTGDDVPYELHVDTAGGAAWGDVIGTNTVAGTGDGEDESFTVAALAPSANFAPGAYSDDVTVTVTY